MFTFIGCVSCESSLCAGILRQSSYITGFNLELPSKTISCHILTHKTRAIDWKMFEPQVAASCQSVSIWPIITKSYRLSKIWTLGECMIIQYITYIYIYLQVIKYFFGGSWTECNQEQSCDQASIVCVAFFDCRILERCSAMYMVTWSTVKLPCLRDSLVVTCVDKNHWQGWYWLHTQFGGTLLDLTS